MTSFYSEEELRAIGFKAIGKQVLISRKTSIYGASQMEIGDNVRIDDFCILSGNIKIGSNVHISAYVALYGKMGIMLEDYTGISPRSTIFSAMDDFSGNYLIGPIHEEHQIHVTGGPVTLKRFSQVGAHCVVFPNIIIEEGAVVGAMSLVNKTVNSWTIVAGIPIKFIRQRNQSLLELI